MAVDALEDAQVQSSTGLKRRQAARAAQSLAEEEAAGRLLALRGRTTALIVIGALLMFIARFPDVLFYELVLALFVVAGYTRHAVERLGLFRWWQPYAQVALDSALLAFALLVPNPLAEVAFPVQMQLRSGNFIYFYVLLIGLTFSYNPRLVIWGGVTGALAWGVAASWIALLPSTLLKLPGSPDNELLSHLALPNFVDLDAPIQDIAVFLIVSALLALVVARSRRLVEKQMTLERQRSNLARYFPPAAVDRLANQDQALAQIREQTAAVLFFDLVGFTHWAERHSPSDVIVMLREVHARVENAIFANDGTLDKFIGDGAMATFGAFDPGPREVTNALACAVAIVDEFGAWNARRSHSGKVPVRISIGLHYGPVVVGNIGTDRRMEFAVLGDTVNVASRLEALTRDLSASAAISRAVAEAVSREATDDAPTLLSRFTDGGSWALRGRDQTVEVLALRDVR